MSAELHDFRCKISPETDAVLEALSRSTGKDRCELAREVLHRWAAQEIESAKLIHRMLAREGGTGALHGLPAASKGA